MKCFRVKIWDIEHGKLYKSTQLAYFEGGNLLLTDEAFAQEPILLDDYIKDKGHKYLIMIASDIVDKHGAEVCDKDIVSFNERLYVVAYEKEGEVWLLVGEDEPPIEISHAYTKDIEIIGNIVENADLLVCNKAV